MGVDCGWGLLEYITYMAVVGSCMCMVCGYMHILAFIGLNCYVLGSGVMSSYIYHNVEVGVFVGL